MTSQDFSAERNAMVDTQLAGRGLADTRVLDAMRGVPREAFVSASNRAIAYSDQALPIGGGQTISQPYVIALICQALALEGNERVLEVGTGSGYSSAILARLAGEVFTVERDPMLSRRASRTLTELGVSNVTVLTGDGSKGLAEHAPFDAIAVHALAEQLPAALIEQLAPGGRLVVPVRGAYNDQLTVGVMTADGLRSRALDPVRFVPLVPGTAAEK
jgi:protein-L-isoaspartate(D-aspartate) O-methyltransferase